MTTSKIQMDQIRPTSATVTGENILAGSQKKSSLSPAEGLQGASPDATCTCPSGGGSLRHPCPAHPAPVEQAGGDDRVVGWRERILAAHPNSDPGFWPDALLVEHMAEEIADLRAALAQPSTKCATCNGSGFVEFERGAVIKDCPRCHRVAQPSPVSEALIYACKNLAQITSSDGSGHADIAMAVLRMAGVGDDERERLVNEWKAARAWKPSPAQAEQAEAERPEVVAVMESNGAGGKRLAQRFPIVNVFVGDKLMTVAQHERIVGELLRQKHEADTALAWATRHYQTVEQERDAALARVAGLEHSQSFQRDIDYSVLSEYADKHRLHFNNLCAVVRSALIALPAQAQHSVPEGYALIPTRETEAMHDAVMALLYKGVARTDTQKLLDAYIAAAPGKEVPQAWLDVQAERRRQITAEGWTPEHDDAHSHGEMARAAACYALAGSSAPNDGTAALLVSLAWPWDEQWWKPSTARRDLVKACALALAEIERLDRACISQSPQPGATSSP
ncbi:hypothetical protein ACM7LV_20210 [Pseudomonas aeruginosa]